MEGETKRPEVEPPNWLTEKRDAIMVVASLIATMAFQAGVTPPGGVWQDNNDHKAGEAVIAYHHPKSFRVFMRVNTVAFLASLSTILLLISGLPLKSKFFMWMLMVVMWLTITSIAATYAISIAVVTPHMYKESVSHIIEIGLVVWCSVMVILLVGNTIRLVDRWLKGKRIYVVHSADQWLKNRGIEVWRPERFRSLPNDQNNI